MLHPNLLIAPLRETHLKEMVVVCIAILDHQF